MIAIVYREAESLSAREIQDILEELGESKVTDAEVWEEARVYQQLPHFENILTQMAYDRLEEAIPRHFPDVPLEVSKWVHGPFSEFKVNGVEINSLGALLQVVEETKEEMEEEEENA